jgi:GTP pyrophosphokinase
MDEIAEKGFAAHWKYKGNDTRTNKAFESWLSQIREALDSSDKAQQSAVELVDDIRSSLYNEEVFVYTPKGKLVVLKDGATALDFAFEIHTEVGARCIGAKVNNKLVPLSYKLKTGDIIECMTSAKQKPSEDWLGFVVTTKAKSRIKDYIKEANKQHVIVGRDMVEHRLKILGINVLTLEVTNQLRAYFNAKDANDLFYRFGKGYIQLDELKRWKSDRESHERKQAAKSIQEPLTNTKNLVKELKKLHGDRKDADALLIGEDMDKIDYTLAKCCNPIAGDDVFGFVTINEGIKIHRTSCPNAPELLSRHGDRVLKAVWASKIEMSFVAHLIIKGTDRMGLMNDVTRVISQDLQVNIQNLSIGVKDGIFEGKIALMVNNTAHLEKLVSSLEQVSGVVEIERGE